MTDSASTVDELKQTLADSLAEQPGLVFAILYGSAVEHDRFRDLDVAVFVDRAEVPPEADLEYAFALADALEARVPYPVDVRIVNDAPLPFRYNVTKGVVLVAHDEVALADFRERTWDMYLDFQPFVHAYFREALGGDSND